MLIHGINCDQNCFLIEQDEFEESILMEESSEQQCDSYEDYTNLFADVTEGQSYSVTVSLGDCDGYNFPSGGYVYIDWNIDGDFNDPGELIGKKYSNMATTQTTASHSLGFTVPSNKLSNTRIQRLTNVTLKIYSTDHTSKLKIEKMRNSRN